VSPIDMKTLIERAKTAAAVAGVSTPNEVLDSHAGATKLAFDDSEVQRLVAEIEEMAVEDEKKMALQKVAATERARNLAVAKALAAIDILSEVR